MNNLEEIGWKVNFSPRNNKRIYFFKDTNHANQLIQDRLFEEISNWISSSRISKVLIDGFDGKYKNNFASENQVREHFKKLETVTDSRLLCLENFKIKIYYME